MPTPDAIEPARPPQAPSQAHLDFYDRLTRSTRLRALFDGYAPSFDHSMTQLGYVAPRLLVELVALEMPGRTDLRVLDLGCGTGLAGQAVRDRALRLDGIDLSPAMIDQARERGVYDSLDVADLETALAAPGPTYDLILAADVLVYLGDLASAFRAAGARLVPGGAFCFTVEAKDGDGFEQGPWRRWLHSEAYLRDVAANTGLAVSRIVQATPRNNFGVPVPGFVVALRKPPAA